MEAKCGKSGCEKAAVNQVRFTSMIHTNIHNDEPVGLCEEHTKEVKQFPAEDAGQVKKWLKS
jgi:hypothetical protein